MQSVPTVFGIRAYAHLLARYATLIQELVEPEVLLGGAHDIERCEIVTSRVLDAVFTELDAHRVLFESMLLKPNMVIAGMKCARQESVQLVAEATIRCMIRFRLNGLAPKGKYARAMEIDG